MPPTEPVARGPRRQESASGRCPALVIDAGSCNLPPGPVPRSLPHVERGKRAASPTPEDKARNSRLPTLCSGHWQTQALSETCWRVQHQGFRALHGPGRHQAHSQGGPTLPSTEAPRHVAAITKEGSSSLVISHVLEVRLPPTDAVPDLTPAHHQCSLSDPLSWKEHTH